MIEADGLRLAERRELAAIVRDRIEEGDEVLHVLLQPGDSTHYELILARLGRHPMIGATYDREGKYGPLSTACGVLAVELVLGSWWMLSWEGHGCMLVDLSAGHYTDPSYVGEKLRIAGGSAAVIAEILSMVAGCSDELLASMRDAWPVYALADQDGEDS